MTSACFTNAIRQGKYFAALLLICLCAGKSAAQVDPIHRNLIELGIDESLSGQGPQGLYAYYYYNKPDFLNNSNIALRVAFAPAYLDTEIGFKQVLSKYTDIGVGLSGGAFGDNFYEVRQGRYYKSDSFDGSGGGASVSLYQLLNPGMLIPLNVVARGGFHYATYESNDETATNFFVPHDGIMTYTRVGLRLAGKEPILYPDLGLEVSVWYERDWRFNNEPYGYANDRRVNAAANLYWAYAGLNYSFTNTGQKISFAVTAGGSTDADRFSAWRLGGVLPLISEFPLTLPGYYYQELTATRFVHLYAAYDIPLDRQDRWKFRIEAASAALKYLPGFEQPDTWQTGAGGGITFRPKSKRFSVVARYGYGFNARRTDGEGSHSVGLLFQYDFEAKKAAE